MPITSNYHWEVWEPDWVPSALENPRFSEGKIGAKAPEGCASPLLMGKPLVIFGWSLCKNVAATFHFKEGNGYVYDLGSLHHSCCLSFLRISGSKWLYCTHSMDIFWFRSHFHHLPAMTMASSSAGENRHAKKKNCAAWWSATERGLELLNLLNQAY